MARSERIGPQLIDSIGEVCSNMSSADDAIIMSHARRRLRDGGAHVWTWLVSSREDGRVVLWDVVTQPSLRAKSLNSLACFSPSSSYFAVAVANSFVTLYKRYFCQFCSH